MQWSPFCAPPVEGKELTDEQLKLATPKDIDLPMIQNDLNSVYCCRRYDLKTHVGKVRVAFQNLFNKHMFPDVPIKTTHDLLPKSSGAVANLRLIESGERKGFPMIVMLRAQHVLKAVSAFSLHCSGSSEGHCLLIISFCLCLHCTVCVCTVCSARILRVPSVHRRSHEVSSEDAVREERREKKRGRQ